MKWFDLRWNRVNTQRRAVETPALAGMFLGLCCAHAALATGVAFWEGYEFKEKAMGGRQWT